MRDIWFTSDNHFGHRNMVEKFTMDDGRRVRHEFNTLEECDRAMIDRWNSVIKPEDKVYHLGDFAMSKQIVAKVMPQLMGNIRLLLGNHDPDDPTTWLDIQEDRAGERLDKPLYTRRVQKLGSWRRFPEGFVCCHYPLHPMCITHHHKQSLGIMCVHGHEHRNKVFVEGTKIEDARYFNVCVENHNYTPVHFDTIIAEMRKRGFKPNV